MNSDFLPYPTLIEPGARYFFKETLKKCHEVKVSVWNKLVNIIMFLLFAGIIGLWLWWNYGEKQKKIMEIYDGTAEQKAVQAEAEMLRILGQVERERMRFEGALITELPMDNRKIDGSSVIQFPRGFAGNIPVDGIQLPPPPPESQMYGLPPPILPPIPVPAPAVGLTLPSSTTYGNGNGNGNIGGTMIQSLPSGFESMYSNLNTNSNKNFI